MAAVARLGEYNGSFIGAFCFSGGAKVGKTETIERLTRNIINQGIGVMWVSAGHILRAKADGMEIGEYIQNASTEELKTIDEYVEEGICDLLGRVLSIAGQVPSTISPLMVLILDGRTPSYHAKKMGVGALKIGMTCDISKRAERSGQHMSKIRDRDLADWMRIRLMFPDIATWDDLSAKTYNDRIINTSEHTIDSQAELVWSYTKDKFDFLK